MKRIDKKKMFDFDLLDKLVEKAGVKQYVIAKAIGLSPVQFSNWMKKKSAPTLNNIFKLANYFRVEYTHFIKTKN